MVQLTETQSQSIHNYFRNILIEERQDNDDKKQAILLHLQMILVETQRAGKTMAVNAVSENYNYIYKFLTLPHCILIWINQAKFRISQLESFKNEKDN